MSSLHYCPACRSPLQYEQGTISGDYHERVFSCALCVRSYTFVAHPGKRASPPTRWGPVPDPNWEYSLRQKLDLWWSKYENVVVRPNDG